MIQFGLPLVFIFLPLPWFIYRFFPRYRIAEHALKVSDMGDFDCFEKAKSQTSTLSLYMASFIWLLFLLSAARPVMIQDYIPLQEAGRDIMLAVDLSGSMQIKDFEINGKVVDRLTALKKIASDFIEKRPRDRMGLILFGSEAYLQAPLTFDKMTVKQLLLESELGLAGTETAIGDAVGLAIKHLKTSDENARVLILLTDGNNNSGNLTPQKAAEIASNAKLKIHTVAIGSKNRQKGQLGVHQMRGQTDIDEKALQAMADKTGGKYFRAYNTKELAQIYNEIDQLETVENTNQHYLQMTDLYYWPLLAAILLLSFYLLLRTFGTR